MEINVLDNQFDNVIKSSYVVTMTSYEYAIEKLVPLIDKFELQRNTLPKSFYNRLRKDILDGCIVPPLTVAIVNKDFLQELDNFETKDNIIENEKDFIEKFINDNIDKGFILDGIQRLNVLKNIFDDDNNSLQKDRPIYLNILIADSIDKLLYRMITLNNGQKPMSPRHQIEVLLRNVYDFDELPIELKTEKESNRKKLNGSFKKEDIIKSYLAFCSNSVNIDNQKIIESKMDELVTEKIIDSDIPDKNFQFMDIIEKISGLIQDKELLEWFQLGNNLIGFFSGISSKMSFYSIKDDSINDFKKVITNFEKAFKSLNVSKIKTGMARRKCVEYIIKNYAFIKELDDMQILDKISLVD